MNDNPVWKTILSIAVCLFAIIRIAITCSNNSKDLPIPIQAIRM